MTHDRFDAYRFLVEDTNQLNIRRQRLDSLYVSLITFVLSGDAYIASTTQFNNWLPVIATTAVGIVGIVIIARWNQALKDLDAILENRYAHIRALESDPSLSVIGADIYTDEYNQFYRFRKTSQFRSATKRLQAVFRTIFAAIPVALALLTVTAILPLTTTWMHEFVSPILTPTSR